MHQSLHETAAATPPAFEAGVVFEDAGRVSHRAERLVLLLAVSGFLAYAAAFIYRTSFVIAGERYFSLFDDAMVSMRYARNLAEGYGLVWNPGGERVEGYTNPLWVLYMALLHRLPVPASKTSLLVQVSAAVCLALNLLYVRRIALAISDGVRLVAWAAIALTATYLPINFWGLQGMEVSVLVLLTTACAWLAISAMDAGRFDPRLYLLLGVGTLVRPDMVIPFVAFAGYMLLVDSAHWRQHAAWGVLVLAAAVLVQTLFRLWYYGDVFPNTYYLKMTGVPFAVRVMRGADVTLQFVWRASPVLFLLTALLAFRSDRRIRLLLWILAVQVTYSVYVGGDAWEYWGGSNRYVSIAMSGFFVVLSHALHLTAGALAGVRRLDADRGRARARASILVFAAGVAYAAVAFNSIHGRSALAEAALIRPPLHTGPGGSNHEDVEEALLLRAATAPDASIAVVRAGTIPYFAERPTIDLLGKNDRYIAREPARVPPGGTLGFRDFRPGHMKFDFAYSIGQLRPDVIVHLRRRTALAKPFLDAGEYKDVLLSGRCVHARRHSIRVFWDRLPVAGCTAAEDPAAAQSR
ncbi:MAG TPA: hypothetical protein VFT47_10215 [Vicinamibacterales bacterium]|nr:hypothetical protein [Vicinamibacterales bacterium]